MKKIIAIVLCLATLCLCLTSCAACDKIKSGGKEMLDGVKDGVKDLISSDKTASLQFDFGTDFNIAMMSYASGTEEIEGVKYPFEIIQATVTPDSAPDKTTLWAASWEDNQEGDDAVVTDFVTVQACTGEEPWTSQPGANYCKITCLKPFKGTVNVRCTTAEGGFTADCKVTYVGKPSFLGLHQATDDGYQFVNYTPTLESGSTYSFKMVLDNVFHRVGTSGNFEIVKCYGSGSYVGEVWVSGVGNTGEERIIDVSELLGSFFFNSEIDGDTLTLDNLVPVVDYVYPLAGNAGVHYKSGIENVVFHIDVRDIVSGVQNTLNFKIMPVLTSVVLSDSTLTF